MKRLVQDMKETMAEYGGVGLAAPQVHEPIRLAVLEFDSENPRYRVEGEQPLLVVFNTRITVLDKTPSGFWKAASLCLACAVTWSGPRRSKSNTSTSAPNRSRSWQKGSWPP